MNIQIITDSACDLPLEYIKANKIEIASLEVNVQGEFIKDDLGQTLKYDVFYDLLRQGETTSTSQVNIYTFEELFETYIKEGTAIIYIGLSEALSGTFNSAKVAKANLLEKYPDADITLINSKGASLGEGGLVYYTSEMLKTGKSKEEVVRWVEDHTVKMRHEIVVDSLQHLKRGGRISGATAAVGTLLSIKPTLKLDETGSIVSVAKVKGKKNVTKYMLKQLEEHAQAIEDQTIFIVHADCEEAADEIKQKAIEQFNPKEVMINCVGGVIGTHVGPGALAIMFLGKSR